MEIGKNQLTWSLVSILLGLVLGFVLSNVFFDMKYELYIKQRVFDECFDWYSQDHERGIGKDQIDICKNKY